MALSARATAKTSVRMSAQVHMDIKPRNFCIDYQSSSNDDLRIYVIDLGGSREIPMSEENEPPDDLFFGSVNWAGSAFILQELAGPKDDIESLGYRCGFQTLAVNDLFLLL